jgi:STE24 endopeptidase
MLRWRLAHLDHERNEMVRGGSSAVLLRRLALPSSLLLILCVLTLSHSYELSFQKNPVLPEAVKSGTAARHFSHLTPYALRPQLRAKAIRYSRTQYAIYFGGVALSLTVFAVLWLGGFGTYFRRIASQTSRRLFVQCLVFVPMFWTVVTAIQFPLDYYSGFTVEHHFGLSTQGIPSWLADWGRTFGITVVATTCVVWAFYRIIRRSPNRWWLFFWLALIPPALFVMFVEPYVIEPLYFRFIPLEKSDPSLTAEIEGMLKHAGLNIPELRIYEMNASAKTRTLNAYVSGFAESARVVVWDTTLRDLTPDETLSVLGHEIGHYVLHHVIKEFVLDELLALGWFYVGFIVLEATVKRKGSKTGIEGSADLASLPLVMLILTAILFLASPIYCAISRHYEHQADQYGLEVTYGILPDPNASMVRSFQTLEADDLGDPDPNPFIVFWLYTHPPVAARIRFADYYKPWAHGQRMELVR